MLYRTRTWCVMARGASVAERDQCRALRMRGKHGPQMGDDPWDPHRPGALTTCRQVPWHTHRKRCTTGPVGCGPGQGGSLDAGEGLLRNRKMRSYHSHTDSETKTVTVEPDCKDTMVMHVGSSAGVHQGDSPAKQDPQRVAGEIRREKEPRPPAPRSLEHPAGPPLVALRRARGAAHNGTTVAAGWPPQTKRGHRAPVAHGRHAWGQR